MNPKRPLLYLCENDQCLVEHINIEQLKQNLKTTDTSCEFSHNIIENRFYHQLDIDNEYSFDNHIIGANSRTKKQKKIKKMLEKQTDKIFIEHNQQKYNILQNQQNSLSHPFQDDISSISFLTDRLQSQDSVFYKLQKYYKSNYNDYGNQIQVEGQNLKENQQNQQQELQELQKQSENEEQIIKTFMINQKEDKQQKNIIKIDKQKQQKFMKCKDTWMKFQNINRFTRKFFVKNEGVIVHPQYSKIAEDCSELAVEGKAVMFKIKNGSKNMKQDKHQNFLKQVFLNQPEDKIIKQAQQITIQNCQQFSCASIPLTQSKQFSPNHQQFHPY